MCNRRLQHWPQPLFAMFLEHARQLGQDARGVELWPLFLPLLSEAAAPRVAPRGEGPL
jgi:hypothetical protein